MKKAKQMDAEHAKAVAAADQENAKRRDCRNASPDRMTASERAMAQSATHPPGAMVNPRAVDRQHNTLYAWGQIPGGNPWKWHIADADGRAKCGNAEGTAGELVRIASAPHDHDRPGAVACAACVRAVTGGAA